MLRQTYTFPLLRPLSLHPVRLPNLLPKPLARPFLIDPFAFAAALFGAPLVVALVGFWVAFIPVFALVMGGPIYLMLGTPVLLWFLPRNGVNPWSIGILAFVTCIIGLGVAALVGRIAGSRDIAEMLGLYMIFGPIMAPIWGLAFGLLYPVFERKTFKQLNAN